MKRAIRCSGGCQKLVRLYGSFQAKIQDVLVNPITGERKDIEYTGYLCRGCAELAGYKVKK